MRRETEKRIAIAVLGTMAVLLVVTVLLFIADPEFMRQP